MKYIDLEVRAAFIIHGYDENNKEIEEVLDEQDYVRKLISVNRIQSATEQYLLVNSNHGRVIYWEYKTSLDELKEKLAAHDMIID